MDFVAVPPGTAAPAALTLRGPDPDLELAPGDDFITAVGAALGARNNAGGARRLLVQGDTDRGAAREPRGLLLARGCISQDAHW